MFNKYNVREENGPLNWTKICLSSYSLYVVAVGKSVSLTYWNLLKSFNTNVNSLCKSCWITTSSQNLLCFKCYSSPSVRGHHAGLNTRSMDHKVRSRRGCLTEGRPYNKISDIVFRKSSKINGSYSRISLENGWTWCKCLFSAPFGYLERVWSAEKHFFCFIYSYYKINACIGCWGNLGQT